MKKYIKILTIILLATNVMLPIKSLAQKKANDNKKTIESIVVDEKGNPIIGATIYGSEGAIVSNTDNTGKFIISVPDGSDLLIEAEGYEPLVYKAGEYGSIKAFTLKTSVFRYGENDDVNIAFGKVKRGDLVNAVSVINPSEVLKYDNIQGISEVLNGRTLGLLGSSNMRGIGNALFIVDGLPRNIGNINLAEIEEITVLKDINSSILYGNDAVNGVILITTKRGKSYKRQINVSGYYGLSTPTAMPKYLSSVDYMELYNEAKVNDGLVPQYDAATIDNYRSGNPYRYPNVDYYSSDYLKNVKPFSRIMTELSGGNDVATYYSNLGWEQTGSLLNFGTGKDAKQNRFNARGNVDLKINRWIKSSIDAVAVLNNSKGPIGNYWSEAATRQPNLYSPLIPLNLIDPENLLVKGRKNDVDGAYLLGGTSSYLTNAFANGYSGGENQNIQRTFSIDNRIDFDLKSIVEGLAFHTNVSIDFYTTYNQSIVNEYSVYSPVWDNSKDSILSITKYGTDVRTGSQNIGNALFMRRFGFYGMLDYDRIFRDVHHFQAVLLGYGNLYKIQGDFQGNKNANLGLRLAYSYNKKYLLDFSSSYVNSIKLPEGNRGAFSPSVGMAWVISSEDFLSPVTAINYLKVRLSAGIINSDLGIDGFYFYDNRYGTSGNFAWFDGTWSNSGTISGNGGNNLLSFEKRREFNFGFEGLFFNKKLAIDANIFASEYFDQVTRPTTKYPSFMVNYIPYENFDSNSYKGGEIGLSYSESIGDFSFTFGVNTLYTTSEVLKKDELYSNSYQYRTGKPTDARFGLVADGFFKDQADIDSHETQAFGKVVPGDIKYVDQNNDGIIDSDDEIQIGRWQAPLSYGLNLLLSYKNFTLFAQGNGRRGADGYLSDNYYWVDGNDKYSEFVKNRWTEATKNNATFPRLSSLANTNNFRSSTFWLYKDNYFTVDRVQLTYNFQLRVAEVLKMKSMSVFANASNLLTVSKHKEYRELRIGSEPYYRSFTLGVKTMF